MEADSNYTNQGPEIKKSELAILVINYPFILGLVGYEIETSELPPGRYFLNSDGFLWKQHSHIDCEEFRRYLSFTGIIAFQYKNQVFEIVFQNDGNLRRIATLKTLKRVEHL